MLDIFKEQKLENELQQTLSNESTNEIRATVTKITYHKNTFAILRIKWTNELAKAFPDLKLGYNKHNLKTNTTVAVKGKIQFTPQEEQTVVLVDPKIESNSTYGDSLSCEHIYPENHGLRDAQGKLNLNDEYNTFDGVVAFLYSEVQAKVKGLGMRRLSLMFEASQKAFNLQAECEVIKVFVDWLDNNEEQAFVEHVKSIHIGLPQDSIPILFQIWRGKLGQQNIYSQLFKIGLSRTEVPRVYKEFGQYAIDKIYENPYQLVSLVRIGFKKADAIANRIDGFDKMSIKRQGAGVFAFYAQETQMTGDTLLDANETFEKLCLFMNYTNDDERLNFKNNLRKWFARGDKMKLYELPDVEGTLKRYFTLEQEFLVEKAISTGLADQIKTARRIDEKKIQSCRSYVEGSIPVPNAKQYIKLDPSQIQAVGHVLRNPVSILTGGAGCGKTTILRVIITCAQRLGFTVGLCSPTGKAAKRMTESIGINGLTARTIHSLFKLQQKSDKEMVAAGQATAEMAADSVDVDTINWLFIDESSMIDMYMMKAILGQLKPHTRITFIGDYQQLPSVGKGCVFFDMISSKQIPTARLTQTHRQAGGNDINDVAHLILQNDVKSLALNTRRNVSFENFDHLTLIEQGGTNSQQDVNYIVSRKLIQDYRKLTNIHGFTQVQILTPSRKAAQPLSSNSLNQAVRQELGFKYPYFQMGERVIGTKNNHIFKNGEVGTVKESVAYKNNKGHYQYETLKVLFDGEDEPKECKDEADRMDFAYAITVHKSQGSEYQHILIPMVRSDIFQLNRNWFYTAVTRGKSHVHLYGQSKAIGFAVRKQSTKRNTLLRHLLTGVKQIKPNLPK